MSMNKDQAKGRVKEAAGALTDDEELKKEGKADQLAGDAKDVAKNIEDKAEKVIDDVKEAVRKDR